MSVASFYVVNDSLRWILFWSIPILIASGFLVERLTRGQSARVQRFAQGIALPVVAVLIATNGSRLVPKTEFVSMYCEMAWWDLCYWLPVAPTPEPVPTTEPLGQ